MEDVDLLPPGAVNASERTVQSMTTFGERMRALMDERGVSLRGLAKAINYDVGYLSKVLNNKRAPSAQMAERLDKALGAAGRLAELRLLPSRFQDPPVNGLDEIEALELARRVAASDVGTETINRLELVVDDLAIAYPGTPPDELLYRTRRYLGYVAHLIDAKKTLSEQRRLLAVGGWLSLLASTSYTDLHNLSAATEWLRTAVQLAKDAGHSEIEAWSLETRAWQSLTNGDYRRAVVLSQGAQEVAPRVSSAYIQATAQEGRAWARLNEGKETRDALRRVSRLVSPLPIPDRPEHHYRYDPAKNEAYVATTLSWLGDPAAETYARHVLERLESPASGGPPRPRRAVSARLDLALTLMANHQHDEAAELTMTAVTSGRLVPSHYWRARELIIALEERQLPQSARVRDAYRELCVITPRGESVQGTSRAHDVEITHVETSSDE